MPLPPARRRLLIALSCILLLIAVPDSFAGAWTQQQQGYYFKLAAHYLNSNGNYAFNGKRLPKPGMGELSDLNLMAYGEYGLHQRLTLVAAAPYKRLSDIRHFALGVGRETSRGFGDLELRLRWQLASAPLAVAIAAGGSIPLGYSVDRNTRVPLGTGEKNGDIRLLLGHSLYPLPGYLSGEVGYRIRGGPYSDEWFYLLEAGWTARRFFAKGFISGLRTLGTCGAISQAGLVGDQDLLKISPGLGYRPNERLEIGLDLIHILAGCNTTTGSVLALGVAFKR